MPRSSRPACGSAFAEPSTVLLGRALKPRPAAIAKSARKASAATIHGSELDFDSRTERGGSDSGPAAVAEFGAGAEVGGACGACGAREWGATTGAVLTVGGRPTRGTGR